MFESLAVVATVFDNLGPSTRVVLSFYSHRKNGYRTVNGRDFYLLNKHE